MAKASPADDWVPAMCTLPTAEQPLRVAEFDDLFRTAVHGFTRTRTTRLDLTISHECEATARNLAERESGCCAFFRFDFESSDDGLVMQIGVPNSHVDILDALQARVSRISGGAVNRHV